jgi:hypothetical protein
MIGRRTALQAIGLGALAAPAAAREIGRNALNGPLGYGAGSQLGATQAGIECGQPAAPWEQARRAFADKDTLAAVRAMLFEQHKVVTVLDTDLAVNRSFSLSAKIAFQRQRNVDAELKRMTAEHWLEHPWGIIHKFLGGTR